MSVKKRVESLKITEFKEINKEFFVLSLISDNKLPEMFPGQFVEALVEGSPSTFLRRPLSIHDVNYAKNTIKLLIQIVGDGTRKLSELKTGDKLNLIYPLGNSYSFASNQSALLIGGGCGVAPLLFLARKMNEKGINPDILIGGRNKDYLLEIEEYKKYGNVHITTEDGSYGEKGFVIHHSILWKENIKFDKIYTCGPEAMMKAIAKYAGKKGIDCEVSLENLMACGIGACLCCIAETHRGNICTCTRDLCLIQKT